MVDKYAFCAIVAYSVNNPIYHNFGNNILLVHYTVPNMYFL